MGVRSTLALSFALLAVPAAAHAGECFNVEECATPCPAEFSCNGDAECGPGQSCIPACAPSACGCDGGSWTCTDDCAGVCSGASCPDIDGDSVCDVEDNCPVAANPGQEDCDLDGLGDVCDACPCDPENDIDADAVCAPEDNCPFVANPAQEDTDADGAGDACDCDPLDPSAARPPAVVGVIAGSMGGGMTRFSWNAIPFADRYDLLRGSVVNPNGPVCRTQDDPDPTDLEYVESASPPAGDCWFYLVRGVDDACGGPGPWSDGTVAGNCP